MKHLIDKLESTNNLSKSEWTALIDARINVKDKAAIDNLCDELFQKARALRHKYYNRDIYIRGLIEFTNYCKNDCYYCGIRKSNDKVKRYRLSEDDILLCAKSGYELGFRTFVLQGGEDEYYTDDKMVSIIKHIKSDYPDCAVTLSIGEKSYESYKAFKDAGADRYLLRHETYNHSHYGRLHPKTLSADNRQKCLFNLKKLGYQVGTGFMVGSPYQTSENLAEDMLFIKELNPQMVGIGPYITHKDTPFKNQNSGTLDLTLFMLGLLRLMIPKLLLPATTALGTISPMGRELGILSGANVLMHNLSPSAYRKDYALYDNKICTGDEAAECRYCMQRRMKSIGYNIVVNVGNSVNI
jgi:biotin synthase